MMQELFDRVVTHLLKQGHRAANRRPGGQLFCCYRADDGAKCAVGCIIKDEFYDPSLEGGGISQRRVCDAVEASLDHKLSSDELELLRELQYAHDTWVETTDIRFPLRQIAGTHGLSTKVIDAFDRPAQ